MAIIGFIVLMLLGVLLLLVAVQMWVGSVLFGGGNGAEAILPAILAGAVIWAAFNWAPFTITLVGG